MGDTKKQIATTPVDAQHTVATASPGNARAASTDRASEIMAALLPVHRAMTLEWLVDAAATASERALNAAFTFVYFEEQDGRLGYKAPASDLRRRSLQRAIDAFGKDVMRAKLNPADAPALADALDARKAVRVTSAELFGERIEEASAESTQKSLGIETVCIAPLEAAGERVGVLLLMLPGEVDLDQAGLLADHVACATINLRAAQSAREHGVTDVARSVFDARKLETDLTREIARANRYKREVSIVVLEATNLRLLREQFGKFLTERLLHRLGESLAQNARDVDVLGAYKETGYTMILAEARGEGAAVAAERMLASAAQVRLEGERVPGLELHLAAGWATCPADGTTTDILFAAAERRMYSGEQSQVA